MPGALNYRLERGETVAAGIRRVVSEQIAAAIAFIEDSGVSPDVAVHEIRKACKRIRAALRLVRGNLDDYQAENRRYRDLSRDISKIRDLQVLAETHRLVSDLLRRSPGRAGVEIVGVSVHAYRDAGLQALDLPVEETLDEVSGKLKTALESVDNLNLSISDFEGPVAGLEASYRRTESAGERCMGDPSVDNLHEWRKQAKYHWHQLQLLGGAWPEGRGERGRAAENLADALGEDHDLVGYLDVLQNIRARVPERALGALVRCARERREMRYYESIAVGERWFSEDPNDLTGRFRAHWQAWRNE